MGRRKKPPLHPIFFAADTLGLPLEIVIKRAVQLGWTIDHCILDFLMGAVTAGWSKEKVRSDIRELRLFIALPEEWLFWADGAFDKEHDDGTRSNGPLSIQAAATDAALLEALPEADIYQGKAGCTEDPQGSYAEASVIAEIEEV